MWVVIQAVQAVGEKLASVLGRGWTSSRAFRTVYNTASHPLYLLWGNESGMFTDDGSGYDEDGNPRTCEIGSGACTVGSTTLASDGSSVWLIKFVSMSTNFLSARNQVVHELGHLFNRAMGDDPYVAMADAIDENPDTFGRTTVTKANGFASVGFPWQQSRVNVGHFSEIFADQFLGWVFNSWERRSDGRLTDIALARSKWMTTNMAEWITP
jgi:hypothetical protein